MSAGAIDLVGRVTLEERAQLGHERPRTFFLGRIVLLRKRMQQVEPEPAQIQLAHERR